MTFLDEIRLNMIIFKKIMPIIILLMNQIIFTDLNLEKIQSKNIIELKNFFLKLVQYYFRLPNI
jgi:hypothetical protein